MRPLARSYLQHGSRHLPTGSDPIPVAALQAIGLPSAVFTKTISSPITAYLSAQNLAFDTVQTPNPEYFSVTGTPAGILQTGFYMCVGMIHFASAATDWSGVGGGSFAELLLGSSTTGTVDFDMTTSYPTAAAPTYINHMEVTNFVSVGGGPATLTLGFAVANNISALPVGISVARAVVVRISGEYSITL